MSKETAQWLPGRRRAALRFRDPAQRREFWNIRLQLRDALATLPPEVLVDVVLEIGERSFVRGLTSARERLEDERLGLVHAWRSVRDEQAELLDLRDEVLSILGRGSRAN